VPRRKQAVRPPTLGEAMRARQAHMKARVEALRNNLVEPILARFPGMLPTKPDSAARYAIVSSIIWFVVGLLFALLLAVKLVFPRLLAQFPWMSFGRLAAAETAVMTYGVLFLGFAGAIFAVVPRLTGAKLWSERIGAQTVILHDQVLLAGVVLVLIGRTQGIPGLELPWPIDILLLNSFLMLAQNVAATIARRVERRLAPPLWYYMAAIVILPATYAFGNLAAPWYVGVNQQIVAGFAVAGTAAALAMMGIGTAYYVLPRATGLPIYSERLALMGFWSLVFAAPWVGQVWGVLGPTQDYLETAAIVFAVWLVVPALCVLVNFWGTLRGGWQHVLSDPAVRFIVGGSVFLTFSAIHFAVGSLRTVQNIVGHTTWDIATQTALAGGLGMFLIALIYHLYPRITGRALYRVAWGFRHFWLVTVGLTAAVLSMSVAGAIQGYLQIAGVDTGQAIATGQRWSVITLSVRPLFVLRIAGGGLIFLGLILFLSNLIRTAIEGEEAPVETPVVVTEPVGATA